MEHELRLKIFWVVHLLLLGLFGLELIYVLSVWLKARVPGLPANASRWYKFSAAISFALGVIFSRRLWPLLKAFVVYGMIHPRLFRVNLRRWLVHISVFGSWLVLGVASIISGFVIEILPRWGLNPEEVASIPIIGQFYHADVWWVAFLNELFGLLFAGGMLLIIYRRYVQKDPQLRTAPADTIVITLLTLIALSGFPTETFRLLSNYTTAIGAFAPDPSMLPPEKYPLALYQVWGPQWGFAGYALALVLGALELSRDVWRVLHNIFFWLHFIIINVLLFLLPFTRFFHVIVSPIIVAYNTIRYQERHKDRAYVGREIPESAG